MCMKDGRLKCLKISLEWFKITRKLDKLSKRIFNESDSLYLLYYMGFEFHNKETRGLMNGL